jgi:acyl-CoA reductase-like NAD-dependent aldehyde dehydrogenase
MACSAPELPTETSVNDWAERVAEASFQQTIDGAPAATDFEEVINPATGRSFQRSPVATSEEIERAIRAARRAQPGWAALSWDEREGFLQRLADGLDAEREWLAVVHTLEQGRPLEESRFAVDITAQRLRRIAARRIADQVLVDDSQRHVVERWSPLGVVAAIAPWNGPMLLGMIKVATALITGNTLVLKPSELTPLSTLEIGRISQAILPPGVLNVVAGGRATGAAMVAHPGFDKVSFTGSTATGIHIARQSAEHLRPVTLELGGNDAAILLPDGSIPDLVTAAVRTGFSNNGQFCAAVKRIYAPPHLYEQVCEALAAGARTLTIGDGMEPDIQLGPIQNKAQFDKVCAIVEDAKAAGARIVCGGAPLDRPGYFYPPTVVADITDGVRLVDEEQFGPVIPVIAYEDLDAVVDRINSGRYGLTGSVWTADVAHGEEVASRLAVGSAWVNQHAAFDGAIPFPLIKASGMGVDYADHGLKATMRMQIIHARRAQPADV